MNSIYKIVFILFFHVFLFQLPLQASDNTLPQNAKPSLTPEHVEIIQNFRSQNQVRELKDIKVKKPKGAAFADAILFLTSNDDSCPLVVKIFKDLDSYTREKTELEKTSLYIALVDKLKTNCQYDLPYIMEYKGSSIFEGKGAVLVTKAEGKTVDKIYDALANMDDTRIRDIFQTIGSQLATLDGLFYTQNYKHILVHPDSHMGNYMYDESKKQLYIIDTAGLAIHEVNKLDPEAYAMIRTLEAKIFGGLPETYSYINVNSIVRKLGGMTKEAAEKHRETLIRTILAFKSFYEGYSAGLTNQGIPNDLMSEFNKTFTERKYFTQRLEDINSELKGKGLKELPINELLKNK